MTKGFLSIIAAGILMVGSNLYAEPENMGVYGPQGWNQDWVLVRHKHTDAFGDTYYTYTKEYLKPCVKKEAQKHKKAMQQTPKEIIEAFNNTIEALNALQKNDSKKAEELLSEATQKFDEALKKNPNLKLVPINQAIEIKEFEGSINDIKAYLHDAIKLLKEYRTQMARDLLLPMEDEIDIVTQYLPLEVYPDITQKALKLVKEGKKTEAAKLLAQGFSTIVTTEVVIPIPLLVSQALAQNASKIYKKDPQKALHELDKAKVELQKAILLGYTDKHSKEYKQLYEEIMKIQKEIKKSGHPEKMFENLKKHYNKLLQKTRKEKKMLKASDNVWQGTAKAHQQAAEEELNDKLRFLEMEKTDIF